MLRNYCGGQKSCFRWDRVFAVPHLFSLKQVKMAEASRLPCKGFFHRVERHSKFFKPPSEFGIVGNYSLIYILYDIRRAAIASRLSRRRRAALLFYRVAILELLHARASASGCQLWP
jgi:hypothetical protein